MPAPTWFDQDFFISQKILQHNVLNPNDQWTEPQQYLDALHGFDANATPWDNWGIDSSLGDNVSPNPLFDEAYYFQEVANYSNTQSYLDRTDWTPEAVKDHMKEQGWNSWDHYIQQGTQQGLNPSAKFDTGLYIQTRVDMLNAYDNGAGYGEHGNEWTAELYIAELANAVDSTTGQKGISALQDYYLNCNYNNPNGEGYMDPAKLVVPTEDVITYDPDWTPWGTNTPPTPHEPVSPYDVDVTNVAMTADHEGAYTSESGVNTMFDGVYPSDRAGATITPDDVITGGDAHNTLHVQLGRNWPGFDGVKGEDGAVGPNVTGVGRIFVEHMADKNEQPFTFSAKNISGAEVYKIDNNSGSGAISLSDLPAADVTVQVLNLKGGGRSDTSINFAKNVLDGTNDTLTLDLGTVGASDKVVNISATKGLEHLKVHNIEGSNNFVNLSGIKGITDVTVDGIGNGTITALDKAVTTLNAADAIGNVNVNMSSNTTKIATVTGGSGDDTFTFAGSALKTSSVINGGDGNDTVVVKGAYSAFVKSPQWTGIETVEENGGELTLNAKDLTGLTALTLSGATSTVDVSALIKDITADTFTVTTRAANGNYTATLNGDITNLNYVALSPAAVKGSTASVSGQVNLAADVTNDVSITINSGTQLQAGTTFDFAKAEGDVTLTVDDAVTGKYHAGEFNGTINAKNAANFTADIHGHVQSGSIFNVVNNTDDIGGTVTLNFDHKIAIPGGSTPPSTPEIKLLAAGADTLNIYANGSGGSDTLQLADGSLLTNTQNFNIDLVKSGFTSKVDFDGAQNVTINGDNNAATKVTLQNVGSEDSQSPIDLVAQYVQEFKADDIIAGYANNIDINIDAKQNVELGNIESDTVESTNDQGDINVTVDTDTVSGVAGNVVIKSIDGDAINVDLSGVAGDANGGSGSGSTSDAINITSISSISYAGAAGVDTVTLDAKYTTRDAITADNVVRADVNMGGGADALTIDANDAIFVQYNCAGVETGSSGDKISLTTSGSSSVTWIKAADTYADSATPSFNTIQTAVEQKFGVSLVKEEGDAAGDALFQDDGGNYYAVSNNNAVLVQLVGYSASLDAQVSSSDLTFGS